VLRWCLSWLNVNAYFPFSSIHHPTRHYTTAAISKTMRGRPPQSTLILKHHGRSLPDDELVSDILADYDPDEDDSDTEDDDDSNIGEEDMIALKLTLDVIPPVDNKFGLEFKEKAEKMSTKELMEAWCLNMAGMVYGLEVGEREMDYYHGLLLNDGGEGEGGVGEEVGEDGGTTTAVKNDYTQNQSLNIRKKAALLQKQIESSLSTEVQQLMEEEDARVKDYFNRGSLGSEGGEQQQSLVYGLKPQGALSQRSGRKGKTLKGGATMNIKRALQRNMNVVRIGVCM
jgi:hypothetical protein